MAVDEHFVEAERLVERFEIGVRRCFVIRRSSLFSSRLSGMMTVSGPALSLDDPSLFINRELSWLEFNQRVLDQALDDYHPLLERVKFLAIVGSNLDEFFMVRMATLHRAVRAESGRRSSDGLIVAQELAAPRHARRARRGRKVAGYALYSPVEPSHSS